MVPGARGPSERSLNEEEEEEEEEEEGEEEATESERATQLAACENRKQNKKVKHSSDPWGQMCPNEVWLTLV